MLGCCRLFRVHCSSFRRFSTLTVTEPWAVKLQNRSVIRLSGKEDESRPFLQGLITNDINHLGKTPGSVYSLFLNKSGRVLYDAIIYGSENEGELFLECDSSVAQDLRKHLLIYRIRRKIAIDLVNDSFSVWAAFNTQPNAIISEGNEIQIAAPDPRVKDFGQRILTQRADDDMAKRLTLGSIKSYNRQRYQMGIAEGIKEIVPGKAFPLEVNCDYMHGLSVHKGCYLGQEFTARTYHTGVVRKRIMPIQIETALSNPEDLINQDVMTPRDKPGGKVKAVEGAFGIGLLRIEMVLTADKLLVNKTQPVKTWKPSWWPIVAPKGNLEQQDP